MARNSPSVQALVDEWNVTGVVTRNSTGARLQHDGFTVAHRGGEGTYLVRSPDGCRTR